MEKPSGILASLRSLFWTPTKKAPQPGGARRSNDSEAPIAGEGRLTSIRQYYFDEIAIDADRSKRYRDYEDMDTYSEITAALDLYADEATYRDREEKRSLWAVPSNLEGDEGEDGVSAEEIKEFRESIATICNSLFDSISLEDQLRAHARGLSKYGDLFCRVIFKAGVGVTGLKMVTKPDLLSRVTDPAGKLIGYREAETLREETLLLVELGYLDLEVVTGENGEVLEGIAPPTYYIHFRLLGTLGDGSYGDSMIEAARKTWKELKLLEESLALYRLTKAPDRFVYKIDVGSAPDEEAHNIVRRWMRQLKKKRYIDPSTGTYSRVYNPTALDEDIFLAVRPNSVAGIDRLPGGADVNSIVDIEFFKNKLYTALKTPKSILSGEDSGSIQANRSLMSQNMHFSKTIERLQRALIVGYTTLCQIHLKLLDQVASKRNFDLEMSIVSPEDQIIKSELDQMRLGSASQLASLGRDLGLEPISWSTYILRKVLEIPEQDIEDYGIKPMAPESGEDQGY